MANLKILFIKMYIERTGPGEFHDRLSDKRSAVASPTDKGRSTEQLFDQTKQH